MSETPLVFNRGLVRRRRARAAGRLSAHDFLFREVAGRLADRLLDIKRTFPLALDLGARDGTLARVLEETGIGRKRGIETLMQMELAPELAAGAAVFGPALGGDEEALPFRDGTFDLVLSAMTLHWANDLPGVLAQARRVLKPDGLFLAALPATGTLRELSHALMTAETETTGGAAPRVGPFADVRDLGNLLVRAGFALPVADAEAITVSYAHPARLVEDLRAMGEANALFARHERPMRRDTLARAFDVYVETFAGEGGRVPATFEIVTLTGWAPGEGQPQPLRPGSAARSLKDALE